MKFMFVCFVKRDPVWRSGAKLTDLQERMLNPVIDHVLADSESLCHLMNG